LLYWDHFVKLPKFFCYAYATTATGAVCSTYNAVKEVSAAIEFNFSLDLIIDVLELF
jgi:hypothetical protein